MKFKTLTELFKSKKRWNQGGYAVDKEGKFVSIDSPKACSWCLSGAISKVYSPNICMTIYAEICERLNVSTLPEWNDDSKRTIKDIREAVKGF